jgi:hypothetical protein
VAQADGVPVAGRYPTSSWSPGERIVDARVLALPANPATGGYRILVGLYSPANGERLPIAGSGADSYQIARLRIDAEGIGH